MQIIKDRNSVRLQVVNRAALMLMPGSMPATKEALMAAVNLGDWQDIYAKAVGCVENINAAALSAANAKYQAQSATTCTWLKGGTFPIPAPLASPTGVSALMPDTINIDIAGISAITAGRAFPNFFLHHSGLSPQYMYVKNIRRVGEGEVAYVMKFKRQVKLTHLMYYGAADSASNATNIKISVKVDEAWVEVLNWARTSSKIVVPLNAPTYGSEFRIEFTGYTAGSASSAVLKSILLLTDEVVSPVAVPDIGWGIMVSYGITTADSTIHDEIEKPQYGSLLPCVVGSVTNPLGSGDFKISKVTGLFSNDQPSLADFKYYYGNLEVV